MIHLINRWRAGNYTEPISRIMYFTQFVWKGYQFHFRLSYEPFEKSDFLPRPDIYKTWAYYRCCRGFLVNTDGKPCSKVYSAFPEKLSPAALQQCVEEFMDTGFMEEHCIGNPCSAIEISHPFFLVSNMAPKAFFGPQSLDYRRSRLEHNIANWCKPDHKLLYGTFFEKELAVLRAAVDKNDYNIIRNYVLRKGSRLLDIDYFAEMLGNR